VKHHAVVTLACIALLTGCPRQPVQPIFDDAAGGDAAMVDGGTPLDTGVPVDAPGVDAPGTDAWSVDAAGTDGGPTPDAGVDAAVWDSGVLPGTTSPAPATDIVRTGTGGYILRGTVLTPSGPISPGEVLILGNTIECVATDCTSDPRAAGVTILDTHATISPGLIDGHNHLTYDFLPEWVPDPVRTFVSRYEWRGDPDYSAHVDPEGDSNNDGTQDTGAQCPGAKWGELRSIIHGTTTVQGQSPQSGCVDRLARNADHFHGLGTDRMRTTISGACESGFPARAGLVSDFVDGSATRFMIHMAEGFAPHGTPGSSTDPLREFDCYAGRSPLGGTSLLVDGAGMPYGTSVFIHSIPLTAAQLDEADTDLVRFVWSPSSNIILYGRTADIGAMIDRDMTVGLGPDWTPADSDEMLSEMRFALEYGRTASIPTLTPQRIWEMATFDGADVIGHADLLGAIRVGYRADVVVFGRIGSDPYQAVLESRAADVRLVLIDGAGYYGDLPLEATTAVNGDCDMLDACGTPKYLCVANTPGNASRATETMDDIHGQLTTIMGSYGRASEVLELVDCSL
jgi:5-methylthioadenosine/S-adenosylhomocysteine deaminase